MRRAANSSNESLKRALVGRATAHFRIGGDTSPPSARCETPCAAVLPRNVSINDLKSAARRGLRRQPESGQNQRCEKGSGKKPHLEVSKKFDRPARLALEFSRVGGHYAGLYGGKVHAAVAKRKLIRAFFLTSAFGARQEG